jgi:hypothetical protein
VEPFDIKRVTAEVAARHGVLLQPDDPALVLVTINECVLEKCFARLENRARTLIAEVDACFEEMQQRASAQLTDELRGGARAIREEIQRDIQAAKLEANEAVFRIQSSYSQSVVHRWIAAGLVCAVVLLVFGVVIGEMF